MLSSRQAEVNAAILEWGSRRDIQLPAVVADPGERASRRFIELLHREYPQYGQWPRPDATVPSLEQRIGSVA
jgi:hypothetical protein